MRTLLRPGWLTGHLLVAVAAAVMVLLGSWQWQRGGELDALRNYTYGVQWWLFALVTVAGWLKICRDELVPDPDAGVLFGAVELPVTSSGTGLATADQWDDDPEVAAWNAQFARLHQQHALRRRPVEGAAASKEIG